MAFANAPISNAELQLGRAIWEDVMATGRVTLGANGKWDWLTFDELMSLPQENPEGRGAAVQGLDVKPRRTEAGKKPRKLPEVRPRLFVEEDLVWRTLTGHGEDFRRVPLMEWRLLVVIASTQEEGIIQGDLVRATGQDKRSVPRRTDFLRNKGYIAKRTHLVRGSKTSKLWLVRFAPELPAPSSNAMNKAKALLTRDMEPVPWFHQWVNNKSKTGRDEIHYQNLAQTVVGIIKAWGTLRIRDLKKKLGISGLKWQMKVMSKFLRRFNAQGNMVYAAAKFPGNNFVFKDCVKFIRDPTEQDWRDLLATGKKTKVGSGNSKKAKGKAKKTKKVKGKAGTSAAKQVVRVLKKKHRNTPRPLVSLWEPDKPLVNTIADFIMTGGEQGYTTPEISHAVVTHQFRRYLKTHLDQTCGPDSQPARLREYQLSSELTKTGKGMRKFKAETFTCAGARKLEAAQNTPEESVIDPTLTGLSAAEAAGDPFGFEIVNNDAFHQGASDLTTLCAMKPSKLSKPKRAYRRRSEKASANDLDRGGETAGQEGTPAAASSRPAVRKRGGPKKLVEQPAKEQTADAVATEAPSAPRPARKRRAAQRVSYLDTMDDNMEHVDADSDGTSGHKQMGTDQARGIEVSALRVDESSDESEEEDRSKPGVYIGIPGSLNPEVRKKGRPRKSIVLIFRSDHLKDPNFFSGGADYPRPRAKLRATEPAPTPGSVPVPAPASHTTSHFAIRQQGRGRGPAQAPEVSHAEEKSQLQSEGVNPQVEKDTIVVHNTSATDKSQDAQEDTTTATTSVQTAEQSPSPAAAHAPSSKGEWDCPKCGFPFKGSNGLKYHLEKGKNLCNPMYAENPELMVRKKSNRSGQDLQSDDHAEPTEPSSSESGSECSSAESLPPIPEPRRQSGKPKVPRGKKAAPLRRIDPNDVNDPANQRPRVLLKQRRDLKSRQVGIGGLSVKPRGVEASEAAAKEAAAAKFAEVPADTATAPADSIDVHKEDGVASAEEDDEDLPYIDFIRPKSVKFAGLPDSNPFSEAKDSNGTDQPRNEGSPHRDTTEAQPAVFDPYPAEVLDLAKRTAAFNGSTSLATPLTAESVPGTTRKSLPGKRPDPPIMNTDGTLANDRNGEEKSKMQRTNRICEIITHLVKTSGGVFPTERALHWAVLKVYMAMFAGPDYPTLSGCTRGVSLLVREGALKTATVAVRAHGMWKSLKLVLLADLDANHPAVSNFKEKAKEAEVPEMFIPPPFTLTDGEKSRFIELEKHTEARVRGSGRRDEKSAENISRLTAPYYAKTGMAGVRPRYRMRRGAESSGEDNARPIKRRRADSANGDVIRRRKRKGQENVESPPVQKKRGRKSAADDYSIFVAEPHKLSIGGSHAVNPGISSLPASFFSTTAAPNPAGYSAPTKIKFMVPNSHLEYDQAQDSDPDPEPEPEPEIEDELDIDPIDPALTSIPLQEQQDLEPSVTPGTHADTTELQASEDSKGVWPSFPLNWWEKNGGSFSMKGWLPGNSEQLMENIPKTVEQMAFKNKSRCKTNQWADPNYGDFCTSVDGCRTYELSEVGMRALSGTVGTNYLWMNFTAVPAVSNMAPVNSQWLDQNEWTLETIPYEMLESDDEDLELKLAKLAPAPQPPRPPQRRQPRVEKRGPGRPRIRFKDQPPQPPPQPARKYGRKQDRDPNLRELKLQRELTPYPREPSEYFRAKGQDHLGVDWKAEDTRIAAYVAVSTLMGGINKAMDWGLLMRIFPESKLSNLRKFWSMIRKERDGFILTLTTKFQEDFLLAYEKGELPPFDYENPLDYDWPLLVKWTLALVVREGIELPPNRTLFDEGIEVVHVDKNDFDWRETYHHWQRSVFNKFQDSTSEPAATVLDLKQTMEDNDIVIARSWVRALCCTEPDQYTPYKIRDKFLELTCEGRRSEKEVSDLLEATIFDLEHRRIAIKQKSSALATGRPYKLNEHFSRTLDRYSNEDKFTVAAEFKVKMDAAFRRGQTVEIPWRTEDGMVLAAFNLQAAGRVHVEPVPSSRLNIPFGFKPGFYESRKFPKSYYRFDLQIRPTAAYLYNEQIELLHRATAADNIPAATEDGKLPMWCDFFGHPDRHRWFKMLGGVLFVLSTRGAMTDEFTTQALKPCFEQFEVETVRKWGLKEGLLREITVAGGAVTVTEWWWLVLGISMLDAAGGGAAKASEEAGASNGRRTRDQYAEWASGRSRRRGKYRMIH